MENQQEMPAINIRRTTVAPPGPNNNLGKQNISDVQRITRMSKLNGRPDNISGLVRANMNGMMRRLSRTMMRGR